jgi:phosphoribosylanthranilate isomerase
MFTSLKICGITSVEDALMCVNYGVDLLGFNFYPPSPRYIEPEKVKDIINQLPSGIRSIGILVQSNREQTENIIAATGINGIQLYQPNGITDFSQLSVLVILAFQLKSENLTKNIFQPGVDMILLDSYSKKEFGGTGKSFEWKMIPDWFPNQRLILAGGITPLNIRQALTAVQPAVIDVASGAEYSPGKKDPTKVRALVTAVQDHNKKQAEKDGKKFGKVK